MDTNSNGSITRDEFVSGRPKGADATKSGSLYDALSSLSGSDSSTDSSTSTAASGGMSLTDMSSAFQQMSGVMQSVMLQAQEASGQQQAQDPAALFAKLDSNSDGAMTKEEFLAGKPDNVSDDQANDLWSKIAGNSDSVTQDQFLNDVKQAKGGHGHHGGGAGANDPSAMFAKLDSDSNGTLTKEEFLAGKPKNVSDDQANDLWSKIAGDSDTVTKDQFAEAMKQTGRERDQQDGAARGNATMDPSQLFAKIDSNGDGSMSKAEFLADKPDDVSTDQANDLWSKIAGNSDSITKDQFADSMKKAAPPAQDQSAKDAQSANQLSDQLIQQLRAAIDTYRNTAYSTATAATTSIAA